MKGENLGNSIHVPSGGRIIENKTARHKGDMDEGSIYYSRGKPCLLKKENISDILKCKAYFENRTA